MALFYLKSGTFNGLYKLKVLLLGYNYLHLMDSLDDDVLLPVAQSLQYLDLLIDYPPIASSKYLKNLTSLQSIVISYTGLGTFGEQFANMNNLVEIIIPKCAAPVLDNEAFQFLQRDNIKCVNMSGCGLTLVAKAFAQLPNLEILDLHKNPKLFIVFPDFFQDFMESVNNTKLKYLNVADTGLSGLSEVDVSKNIDTLEYINVGGNQLRDFPSGSSSLKSFSAAHNQYKVGHTLFKLLTYNQIEYIDLSYQKMPAENNKVFSTTTSIFNCSSSEFKKCRIPLPHSLNSIKIAHNSANSIGFMNLGQIILTRNSSLKILDMSFTETRNLSYPVLYEPGVAISIEELTLAGNKMACIHLHYFNKCPWIKWRHLNLQRNKLGLHSLYCESKKYTKPMKFLENIPTLISVDISDNRISDLKVDLSRLQNLQLINLASNELPYLRREVFQQLENLNEVRKKASKSAIQLVLDENAFRCDCLSLDFYKWLKKTSINITWNQEDCCVFDDDQVVGLNDISRIISDLNELCMPTGHPFLTKSFSMVYAIITFTTVGYRFRHTVKYWWLKTRINRQALSRVFQRNYEYHAFVSCERQDAIWVKKNLLVNLENNGKKTMSSLWWTFL